MFLMARFVLILAVAITITIMVTVTIIVVVSPRQAQGRGQVRCAEPAGDSGRRALHSPAGRDVISSQTRRGRPAALIESGGGTGPVKPRQPARLIVKPRGRCQLLRRRLRQMSRRTWRRSLSSPCERET